MKSSTDLLKTLKLDFLSKYVKSLSIMKSNDRLVIEIDPSSLNDVMKELMHRLGIENVILSTIVGTDFPKDNIIRVDYFINIIPLKRYIVIRVKLPRNKPNISSVLNVFKAALSGECETYDLLGITFEGNSFLKRAFFVPIEIAEKGTYPLRKDAKV